jgi:hypothetical protein
MATARKRPPLRGGRSPRISAPRVVTKSNALATINVRTSPELSRGCFHAIKEPIASALRYAPSTWNKTSRTGESVVGNPEAHSHEIGKNKAESPHIAKYIEALRRMERDPFGDMRGIDDSSKMSVRKHLNLQWFMNSRQSLS